MHKKKIISFVIPVLNEEDNISACISEIERLRTKILKSKYNFELIFTDNQSIDKTEIKIKKACSTNHNIKYIRFTKNIGYQRSMLTGIINASGDAIVQFDCDLQDPVEIVSAMIGKWEETYNVVYGIRKNRKETFILELIRKGFYRAVHFLSDGCIPPDAGDFRLIDKKIGIALKGIKDPSPYLRGIIACIGCRQVGIPYNRNERKTGNSKFSFWKLANFGMDGVLSASIIPLQLGTFIGIAFSILFGALFMAYLIASYIFGQKWPPGFTTLVLLVILQSAISFLLVGILGEYVGRIFQMLKVPNPVMVENSAGFGKKKIQIP
jgi:dolichol-phosphate mannosyltransferase